jgi:serine/threonine protein phosphatase 1
MRRRTPRALRAVLDAALVPTWTTRPVTGASGTIVFSQAPGWLPPGLRIYAIGDVRGCLAAFRALRQAIRADLAGRPVREARIIQLGNVIGPGPDSAGVLALLAGSGNASTTLRGANEQMLLDALDGDAAAATDWLHGGGAVALRSWGVPKGTPRTGWGAYLPPAQVAFLRGLPGSQRAGGYFLVPAGVRPGRALARQSPEDLRGIRQVFLSSERAFGAVVVHGHSTAPDPVVRANRIGIDTGAGLGGRLTCAVLEEDRIGFISIATEDYHPHEHA